MRWLSVVGWLSVGHGAPSSPPFSRREKGVDSPSPREKVVGVRARLFRREKVLLSPSPCGRGVGVRAAVAVLALSVQPALAVEVVDDLGTKVHLKAAAQRIVSLAPHVTEMLYAAGAGARVVGAVSYSDFPQEAKRLPRVGSYNRPDLEAIVALKPDLIVGWRSGNPPATLERLEALGFAVYRTEPRELEDVARDLERLGQLAGSEKAARIAAADFRKRLGALKARYASAAPVPMFYEIWNQPLMTVNGEHLISKVMALCGGVNIFGDLAILAPKVEVEAVLKADPEAIVASGMGEARPEWLDDWRKWPSLRAARRNQLYFIPPDIMQRHTPRILDGAERLCGALEEVRAGREKE